MAKPTYPLEAEPPLRPLQNRPSRSLSLFWLKTVKGEAEGLKLAEKAFCLAGVCAGSEQGRGCHGVTQAVALPGP